MKLIVSPSSFLGSHALPLLGDGWHSIRSSEIELTDFKGVSDVLVTGANPAIHDLHFDSETSAEVLVAKKLKAAEGLGRLIMLSSRMVYGEDEFCRIGRTPLPTTNYGTNKLKLERRIIEILGQNNCLILRSSNVFGYEAGRSTFLGTMSSDLLKEGVINLQVNHAVRKDFLPVSTFAIYLARLIRGGLTGIHNFGAGRSVSVGDVATHLIKGFGRGRIRTVGSAFVGQFSMSIETLTQSGNFIERLTEDEVLGAIERVGQQLSDNLLEAGVNDMEAK